MGTIAAVVPISERQLRPRRRVLDRLTRLLPTLRNNLGALATLLGMGLALHRLDRAGGDLAARESSPRSRPKSRPRCAGRFTARCTGWASRRCRPRGSARSSTCGRARSTTFATALIADLDVTPRIHVLAAGLLVIALLVSPLLTIFLASLGLLVWLTGAGAEPRRPAGDRDGAARRFGPALPAP